MPIKFTYRGELFVADTPEEAVKMRALLKKEDQLKRDEETAQQRAERRFLAKFEGPMGQLRNFISEGAHTPWTPDVFLAFIARLGTPQKSVLSLLVTQRSITDEELRKALNVRSNQALAGVLSGISKQAAALGIPARAVFTFQNLRHARKRQSIYAVADKFLDITADMNWPDAPEGVESQDA